MQEGQALSLHLMRKSDKLTVCFQPLASNAADAAGDKLTPLVITGTPAELEEGFTTAICTPLEERFGMLANLEEFSKSTQKARPKVNGKAAETETPGVERATIVPAKKSKRDEQAETAEKQVKTGNLPGAYAIYKKLYEQDKTDTCAENRMRELWTQMSEKTMFPEAATAAEAPNARPVIPEVMALQGGYMEQAEPPQPEVSGAEEDMFAQILNTGRIEGPAAAAEKEAKAGIVPPVFDPSQYEKFIQYQEFLNTQQALGIVQ